MKRIRLITSIICAAIIFASCNKNEDDYIYTAGSSKKMLVKDYEVSIKAVNSGMGYHADSVELDLDDDGVNDLFGISFIDTLVDENSDHQIELSLKVINKLFAFSEVQNSGKKSVIIDDIVYSYDGTFPKKTTIYKTVCGNQPNSNPMYFGNSPKYLLDKEKFNESDFQYRLTSNNPKINLRTVSFSSQASYSSSSNGDSLIGYRFDYTDLCNPMPENVNLYLPFLKQDGPNKFYGWLKLKIVGNEITFIESAVQKE